MADRLDQLAADLEALKIEFEKYFIGVEKRLPGRLRDEVSRSIRRYSPGNDAVDKFRHQGLVQRLGTYDRYWNRILRAIEEGTYERDRFKADFREKNRAQAKGEATPRDEAKAREKAATVGDEAAAFLAQLTGGPTVGLRGRAVADRPSAGGPRTATPPVGMRGRSVADRPSIDTRGIVRESLTPGEGIPRQSAGMPAVGLRGQRKDGRPSGGQPPVARPSGGRPAVTAPPARLSGGRPAVTAPPARPSGGRPAVTAPPASKGLAGLSGLSRRGGGLLGGLSGGSPSPPAPPIATAPAPRPSPPPAPTPKPPAPPPQAPARGQPVSRSRPIPRSRIVQPPPAPPERSAPAAPPMRGAPKAPPSPPMRGAPKAPSPPMRGAPKAPSPPMRGRPVSDD